jgi:hypothetical protein
MEQMYSCPNCGEIIYYGEPVCRNCGIDLDWSAVEIPPLQDEYQYQDYGQEQQWDQQQWEQPPADYQQAGYGQYPPQYPPGQRTRPPKTKKYKQQKSLKDQFTTLGKRKKLISIVVLSVLCVAIAAAALALGLGSNPFASPENGQSNSTPSQSENTPPAVNTPIEIAKFVVDPPVIPGGDTSTLYWEVTGASQVSIDQGIGTVPPQGQQVISPEATTTYTLTASNEAGSEKASVTISVNVGSPKASFTAEPSTIASGGTSTLKWDVKGATKVTIQGIGTVASSGTHDVSPTSTTTYTLTASNGAGVINATATVSIGTSGKPVITSFTATPDFIDAGGSSNLEWFVTNANEVSINQGIGNVATYGSKSVKLDATTIYTLTANNGAGTTSMSLTVTVSSDGKPVISRFTASPQFITTGGTSTLQWQVAGANTIFIDPAIGAVDASGTEEVMPDVTTTYSLSATNDNGTTTATAVVTFSTVNLPVIENFTVNPSSVYVGGSATISWNVSNADTITIDNGIGDVNPTGTMAVSPTQTGSITYTITATNASGSVTNSKVLSVY